MKLTKKQYFVKIPKTFTGKLGPFLVGDDLKGILFNNPIIRAYSTSSAPTINNFLWGHASDDTLEQICFNADGPNSEDEIPFYEDTKKEELDYIKRGLIFFPEAVYRPMTVAYIKAIIEIDTLFRLSKRWNKNASTLYRGTLPERDLCFDALNSCSKRKDIAYDFSCGSVLTIDLPSGFPQLKIYELAGSSKNKSTNYVWLNEEEILLPPCEFKVVKREKTVIKKKDPKAAPQTLDLLEVKLKPRNLAEVLLKRMKNPPADYPRVYLEDERYEYKKSMELLEDYINNSVKKKRIYFRSRVIKEQSDPTDDFEEEKANN